jgi:hypothetical protein
MAGEEKFGDVTEVFVSLSIQIALRPDVY